MLPALTSEGLLPPGIHEATLEDVAEMFGFNPHRMRLIGGLEKAIEALARSHCQRAYLDGSFVTAKELPADYDMCWEPHGVVGRLLDPVLLDLDPPRSAQKAKYLGDILPNVTEASVGSLFVDFFQIDRLSGNAKGIIGLDIGVN